jgi:hypothetical protein
MHRAQSQKHSVYATTEEHTIKVPGISSTLLGKIPLHDRRFPMIQMQVTRDLASLSVASIVEAGLTGKGDSAAAQFYQDTEGSLEENRRLFLANAQGTAALPLQRNFIGLARVPVADSGSPRNGAPYAPKKKESIWTVISLA